MTDFSNMLQQQAKATQNSSNESNFVQRKRDIIPLGKKDSFFGRILPLGNKFFATGFRQYFIALPKKDGSTTKAMLRFPWNDGSMDDTEFDNQLAQKDPLFDLARKIMTINKEHPKSIYTGNETYGDSFRERHQVAAVIVNPAQPMQDGTYPMAVNQSGYPDIRILEMSRTAYNNILSAIMNGNYNAPQGGQFDGLSFINSGITYPLSIELNDMNYNVTVRPDKIVGPMPSDYLTRTPDDLDYVSFDDPYRFSKTTYEEAGGGEEDSYYNYLVKQLQDKINTYEASNSISTQGFESNPYAGNPIPQAPVNPYQGAPAPASTSQATNGFGMPNQQSVQPSQQATPNPAPSAPTNNWGQQPAQGSDTFNPATGGFQGQPSASTQQATVDTTQAPVSQPAPTSQAQAPVNNQQPMQSQANVAPASQVTQPVTPNTQASLPTDTDAIDALVNDVLNN